MRDIGISLEKALENAYGRVAGVIEFSEKVLQGGTVGEVKLLEGSAQVGASQRPFALVMKTQKKWQRHGDPGCWRREYEIYKNGLDAEMPGGLRLPKCLLLEEGEGVTRIWMEFVKGRTGTGNLTMEDLCLVAERLGRFQARFHLCGIRDIDYLRSFPAVVSSFDLWYGKMKKALSAPMDGFPEEIRAKLNGFALRAEQALQSIGKLPETLCQGDVHDENLIFRGEGKAPEIFLIDWDSAGYGRMGEDAVDMLLETFVYTERDVSLMPLFRREIIKSYCEGAEKEGVAISLDGPLVRDIFALAWGFRLVEHFLYYFKGKKEKRRCVDILRAMLEDYDD